MESSSVSRSEAREDDFRIIIAAIVTITLVGVGLSLMVPLLSLELERMGATPTVNGLSTAVGGVGNIFIAPLIPAICRHFGQKACLVVAVLIVAASVLAFRLAPSIGAWFAIRFVFGAALGALFVLSEFWITASAPAERRGLIMGIYATVLALGFAAGPVTLSLTGTTGWPPYLACALLILLALAPAAIVRQALPPIDETPHPKIAALVGVAPVATLAALTFGAIETGMFNQLPLWGTRMGLAETQAALLVSVATLGNLLMQIPIGILSDRMDRRKLLLICTLAGAAGALMMPLLASDGWPVRILLLVWGGVTGAIYSVGLAYLGERFPPGEVVAANAAFVMLYSAGIVAGPPLVGLAMEHGGPSGFPLALAAMLAAYAALICWRMTRTA